MDLQVRTLCDTKLGRMVKCGFQGLRTICAHVSQKDRKDVSRGLKHKERNGLTTCEPQVDKDA